MSIDLPSLQPLAHHPALVAETFSPDDFLLSRSHIPLEELRGELREYLGVLREDLTQLINDDYEQFISLGAGLRGEEDRLKELGEPLESARGEVQTVREKLGVLESELRGNLDARAECREEKLLLLNMQKLLDTLSRAEALLSERHNAGIDETWKQVSRLANEYSQIRYLLQKVADEGCALATVAEPRVKRIRTEVFASLQHLFGSAIREMDRDRIRHSLKLYESMDGHEEGMEVVKKAIQTVCEQTLHLTQPSAAPPADARIPGAGALASAYNRLLNEMETYAALLEAGSEAGWEIMGDAIWPAVAASIRSRLGASIFSAGRPDDLHDNFTTTRTFISALEEFCPTVASVEHMRAHVATDELRRQWQLPVYFQLRWKEIVGKLEQRLVLTASTVVPSATAGQEWVLPPSAAIWEAVQSCWDDRLYLPEIGVRFLRLCLQILSRYEMTLALPEDDTSDEVLHRAAASLVDIAKMNKQTTVLVPADVDVSLSTEKFESKIIVCLTTRAVDPLKMIRSVASQIRAAPPTRKTAPRPSDFIKAITQPLSSLLSLRPSLAGYRETWARAIAVEVFTNYASALLSVRKTEDLLRRHRKIKKTGFSLFGSGAGSAAETASDEGVFEDQMRTDIEALKKAFESFGIACAHIEEYKQLEGALTAPLDE